MRLMKKNCEIIEDKIYLHIICLTMTVMTRIYESDGKEEWVSIQEQSNRLKPLLEGCQILI